MRSPGTDCPFLTTAWIRLRTLLCNYQDRLVWAISKAFSTVTVPQKAQTSLCLDSGCRCFHESGSKDVRLGMGPYRCWVGLLCRIFWGGRGCDFCVTYFDALLSRPATTGALWCEHSGCVDKAAGLPERRTTTAVGLLEDGILMFGLPLLHIPLLLTVIAWCLWLHGLA